MKVEWPARFWFNKGLAPTHASLSTADTIITRSSTSLPARSWTCGAGDTIRHDNQMGHGYVYIVNSRCTNQHTSFKHLQIFAQLPLMSSWVRCPFHPNRRAPPVYGFRHLTNGQCWYLASAICDLLRPSFSSSSLLTNTLLLAYKPGISLLTMESLPH